MLTSRSNNFPKIFYLQTHISFLVWILCNGGIPWIVLFAYFCFKTVILIFFFFFLGCFLCLQTTYKGPLLISSPLVYLFHFDQLAFQCSSGVLNYICRFFFLFFFVVPAWDWTWHVTAVDDDSSVLLSILWLNLFIFKPVPQRITGQNELVVTWRKKKNA